ncbi:MAG: cytochrome c oxidase subunit 3 [Candidatus Phaeomarinobacter sp.]
MADAHAKEHDYHLVDPSPWPFVGSIGAFIMMLGGVVAMKPDPVLGMSGPWVFYIGLAMVLYTMVGWWRDVTKEAEHQGHHTPVVQLHHRYGMVLFIASEVMFFVAWFWAYFDASLFTGEVAQYARVEATGGVWPPVGIETFDPIRQPLMNTLVLLPSGTTVTWAHHALQTGDREGLKWGLICTVVLGVLFSALQAYEYSHAAFGFSGSIYGATFYMATGFHGFHVIIGTIFLAVCLFRAYAGHFTPQHHFGFEAAAWYWHFVDVVWLFLFAAIYVWGAGTPGAH